MPHVQIRTPFLVVGHLLAGSLRATGLEVSVVADPLVDRFRLVHRSGLEPDTLVSLLRAIDPLSPTTSATGALPDGVDFQLDLAEAAGPARMRVHVRAEGQELAARARIELEGLGFGAVTVTEGSVTRARLVHCDTRPLMRQLVRWCARRLGVAAVEEALPIDEDLLELSLVDPETARRPLRTRVVLKVRCDDEPAREAAVQLLEERGFRAVGTALDPDTTDAFAFRPGPLASETGVDARAIDRALRGLLGTLDIDPERWPLVEVADEAHDAVIDLPVARWRTGALRPYAGDSAARFDVVLRTDARDRAEPLRAALESIGFASVRVEGLPTPAFGWSIDHGALEPESVAGQAVLAAVQALKDGDEATADARLWQVRAGHRLRGRRRDVDAITIDAPFTLAGSDAAAARREVELRRVRVLLRHAPDVDVTETIAALRAMGVRSARSDERADPEASLQLGGAHLLAVEALARFVAPTFDIPLPLERVWPRRRGPRPWVPPRGPSSRRAPPRCGSATCGSRSATRPTRWSPPRRSGARWSSTTRRRGRCCTSPARCSSASPACSRARPAPRRPRRSCGSPRASGCRSRASTCTATPTPASSSGATSPRGAAASSGATGSSCARCVRGCGWCSTR